MRSATRMSVVMAIACSLLAPSVAALAQSPAPDAGTAATVTVSSARQIVDVVDDPDAWFAALSPSGAMLAYYAESGRGRDEVNQVCVYTFEAAGKVCHDLPEAFQGYPYQLAWSPDDASITFSENPIELGIESDIWLLDVASGQVTDLTDDGLTGSWRYVESEQPPTIDYLPFWDTVNGSLLFWRATPLGDFQFDLGVYRIAGEDAELVRDVAGEVPGHLPTFKQEQFFLDGPVGLSPDGSTLAALMTSYDATGSATTGLWFIDLAGGAPAVEVPQDVFDAAVPEWQSFPTWPLGLAWTADGAGVVVLSWSEDTHTPFTVFHFVDAQAGTAIPVVDFSGLESPDAYAELAPGSQLPWRFYSPWTATLSPQGDKLLMVNDLTGVMTLMAAPLPPDGALPQVSAATDQSVMSLASRSSRSADGKVTVYGLLLGIDEQ